MRVLETVYACLNTAQRRSDSIGGQVYTYIMLTIFDYMYYDTRFLGTGKLRHMTTYRIIDVETYRNIM